jgi:hypothetical protein
VGNGLGTTVKYLRGAAGIGLGTTAIYLRCATSAAAGNGLGTAIKYLVNQNAGAGNNWVNAHYTQISTNSDESPCSVAAFAANSEPTPEHVPRFVCGWGPSSLIVFIIESTTNNQEVHLRKISARYRKRAV